VLGIVLLVFHRFSARALLLTALAIMVLNVGEPRPIIVMAGEQVVNSIRSGITPTAPDAPASEAPSSDAAATGDDVSRVVGVFARGGYRDILNENLRDFREYIRSFAPRWWLGSLLPIMLLGAYAARRRILDRVDDHIVFLRRIFIWCLLFGLVGSAVSLLAETVWTDRELPLAARQLAAAGQVVGIRGLGFAYASGFVLAIRHASSGWLMTPLAAVGRTAFSNYLLQTAVAVALFYGIGLGLYGRLNPVLGALIASLTFAVQTMGSVWWLSRFRFGPAEWVWRSLSYGRMQPIRQ
jgi:uncharacterized protein